ncbi:hypothetical protein LENED_007740 [Lentinula edodes]|uniref:Uncharacterized protein n=1 Tax=Lentinula edodes TaxID=5353 RepID=A0A1Q3EF61_LENED|nr:hypothetical protein LENED_007740 [Lentinula edodes]
MCINQPKSPHDLRNTQKTDNPRHTGTTLARSSGVPSNASMFNLPGPLIGTHTVLSYLVRTSCYGRIVTFADVKTRRNTYRWTLQ